MIDMEPYADWLLKTNVPVLEMGSTLWRPYHQGLVPASLKPVPIQLTPREEKDLLRRSGSLFLRYFTKTSDQPTGFWYSVCSEYNLERRATSDCRRRIRRAYERCTVRRVDAAWIALHGYDCYAAAFARYGNAKPAPRKTFEADCMGPFEFWGVFVADKLAGFAKCAMGSDYVAVLVCKLDPEYLPLYSSYALRDTLLRTYVKEQGKIVGDGYRSIAHKTRTHEFLLRFGYQRIYCDLRVVYQPFMRAFVGLVYPLRALVDRLPSVNPVANVQALLAQEGIRRSFV